MPGHAAPYRGRYSRSVIFMRVCGFHHAVTAIYSTVRSTGTAAENTSIKLARKKGCMYDACAAE